DRSPQFTSHFWKSFQKGLVTQVNLSTSFHPQTDGQADRFQIALYEALYGRRCRYPGCWFEVGEAALIGPDSVHDAMDKVQLIRDGLRKS
ncbi:hypothetical protein MTR67_003132, partial [Solanum verrucosum]